MTVIADSDLDVFFSSFIRESHLLKRYFYYSIVETSHYIKNKSTLPKSLRFFINNGNKCKFCNKEGKYCVVGKLRGGSITASIYTEDLILLTRDHIIPKSKGGTESRSNKQILCEKCNKIKSDKII